MPFARLRKISTTSLSYLTGGLAGIQSLLLHMGTTDYAHNFFSPFFWLEAALLLLTLAWRQKQKWAAILYFALFLAEITLFLLTCLPIGPDYVIMLLIGGIRLAILFRLSRQLSLCKAYGITGIIWILLCGTVYGAIQLTSYSTLLDRPTRSLRKRRQSK